NVNSIVAVDAGWMRALLKRLGVDDVSALPVPFTELTKEHIDAELLKRNLVFREDLTLRILSALRAGKHVIFTGPPGTGKTSLAEAVAAAASPAGLSASHLRATATADWTSVETVGAYRMTRGQVLEFRAGQVLQSIEEDRWLVIDELNRSNIDKAIG